MKEGVIFVQKAYYLSTPHLARSMTPKNLYKCVRARACVCVCMCVCQNKGECMRERERERERVMRYRLSLNPRIS